MQTDDTQVGWSRMLTEMAGEALVAAFCSLMFRFVSSRWPVRDVQTMNGRDLMSHCAKESGQASRMPHEFNCDCVKGHSEIGTKVCKRLSKCTHCGGFFPHGEGSSRHSRASTTKIGGKLASEHNAHQRAHAAPTVSLSVHDAVCGRETRASVSRQDTWCEGHIKFFLSEKGHGFIVCKDQGDVFISQDDVQRGDVTHLTAGVPLRFKLDLSGVRPRARDVEVLLLSSVEGVVKSYSARKKYGFVSSFGLSEDVWFSASSVAEATNHRPVGPGVRVRLDIFLSEKGRFRAFKVTSLQAD